MFAQRSRASSLQERAKTLSIRRALTFIMQITTNLLRFCHKKRYKEGCECLPDYFFLLETYLRYWVVSSIEESKSAERP